MTTRPSPHEVRRMWYELPSSLSLEDRALALANAVADVCLGVTPGRAPIEMLDLPTMLGYGALRRAGYRYIDQIQDMTLEQLTEVKGIGHRSAGHIVSAVAMFRHE